MANDDDPKFPSQTADKYVVRFPDGMRDRIAEVARANNRSMNAEIISRLERTLIADAAKAGGSIPSTLVTEGEWEAAAMKAFVVALREIKHTQQELPGVPPAPGLFNQPDSAGGPDIVELTNDSPPRLKRLIEVKKRTKAK